VSQSNVESGVQISSAATTALEKLGGKRSQQLLALIAAVQVLAPIVKWLQGKLDKREDFTITVGGTDPVYNDLHEWVLARIPEKDRKALIASTGEGLMCRKADGTEERVYPRVRLRYDGSRKQDVIIDGCRVVVEVGKEEIPGGSANLSENWRAYLEKITFTATNAAGRDAVVKVIDGVIEKQREKTGPPPMLVPSRWGGDWNRRNDLPPRTLESVILKEGQLERLVADLETFLSAEELYMRLSQPWHRGYLFHGLAGTGKTSVARALANHFDMPLHYLPLGDLEKDADLMSLVGSIKPKSILLLEDVDVFSAATQRKESKKKTSVAAMLNALDGIWTPHGLITIMTTNYKETLDNALLRPGRIDVDEEFTALDREQAWRLVDYIALDMWEIADGVEQFIGRSPAELIQDLRRQYDNQTVSC